MATPSNTIIDVDPSLARTASGVGTPVVSNNARGAFIQVAVTAHAGTTPTLVVKVQGSVNGVDFFDLDATNAATSTINTDANFIIKVYPGLPTVAAGSCNSPLPRFWRLAWTIGGSAGQSFTFSTSAALIV